LFDIQYTKNNESLYTLGTSEKCVFHLVYFMSLEGKFDIKKVQ